MTKNATQFSNQSGTGALVGVFTMGANGRACGPQRISTLPAASGENYHSILSCIKLRCIDA